MQAVPITTNVVSWNPANGEVYSIQHYVMKIVSDLRQIGGFLRVLLFPPPIKPTATRNIVESSVKRHKPKPTVPINVICVVKKLVIVVPYRRTLEHIQVINLINVIYVVRI